jgi:hypothetical protein
LKGLLDVSGCAQSDVQWFSAFLLFDMLFLVELDDIIVVSVPLKGLIGGKLFLEASRVLTNHSYKFIVEYTINAVRAAGSRALVI